MNSNMEKETILVRIVTIVTLIYLPATFVSVSDCQPRISSEVADRQGEDFF